MLGRDADQPWHGLKVSPIDGVRYPEPRHMVLAKVAEHRGWLFVQTYEDQGISGAKGRDQRSAFDTMLKDAGYGDGSMS